MVCVFFGSDEEKPGSAKKRRKSASGTPLSRVGSPGTTPFKPAMTERQQMALLLQMTDPNKQHASKLRECTCIVLPRRLLITLYGHTSEVSRILCA